MWCLEVIISLNKKASKNKDEKKDEDSNSKK